MRLENVTGKWYVQEGNLEFVVSVMQAFQEIGSRRGRKQKPVEKRGILSRAVWGGRKKICALRAGRCSTTHAVHPGHPTLPTFVEFDTLSRYGVRIPRVERANLATLILYPPDFGLLRPYKYSFLGHWHFL